jgi:hypothetical protein
LHLTKTAAYGPADLIDARVLALGVALTPATLAGAWTGRKITGRSSDRAFGVVVEIGLVAEGLIFALGV